MTTIHKTKTVHYTAAQMYKLVNDIEDYPEFLPWCAAADVHHRDEDEARATLHLSFSGMRKSFTTCNRLQKDKMIEVRLIEGPFKRLEGFWRFEPLPDGGCHVVFDLTFDFSNRLLAMAFGPVFSQVAHGLVDAFCQRAEEVYG